MAQMVGPVDPYLPPPPLGNPPVCIFSQGEIGGVGGGGESDEGGGEWHVLRPETPTPDLKRRQGTVWKEMKCSGETEILHQLVHDTTRKSESHELIRVVSWTYCIQEFLGCPAKNI